MLLKISIILLLISSVYTDVIVQTSSGILQGFRIHSGFTTSYFAFKGIPYAEPPKGNLRFRAPVPHKGWEGIRNAAEFGSKCPSNGLMGLLSGGDEDCLFLNVYTNNVNASSPVMVWLYGGAFVLGDGGSFLYGPDDLIKEDIVIVTLNYRLAAFGFLSTGDKNAQGNYGLKDALLALKWVKKNIRNFGGDDTKITLAGESAGGVMTHHLMLSPQSEGLFHQSIMMSGNVFLPFSFQSNPMKKTEALAKSLGLKYNSTEDLMEKLRAVNFKDILKHTREIEDQDYPLGNRPYDFVITIEPEDSVDERLIIDNPEAVMLRGNFRSVPMMIGTTNKEGLISLPKTFIDHTVLQDFNTHPDYFVPLSYNLNSSNVAQIVEVANAMRDKYFQGQKLTNNMKDQFAVYNTDSMFKFTTDRALKIFSQNPNTTIYNYEFSYDGAYNMVKLFLFVKGYEGACHGDDLFYLFQPGFPVLAWPWNHASEVKKRMIRMWANFIKFGNPTPNLDDIVDIKWPKYTSSDEFYMDIGHDLIVKVHHDHLKIWHEFQKKFTGHL
ncbi:unnamed protein product [Chironomus riparius]|uniref:Carboxylic ester hydrolase n=1 Tax=Chironomus riparius TaxID=315576 RepID=A0A9N9RL23_9DIPT|nr:unnamed protein product [Chironomus riparius]